MSAYAGKQTFIQSIDTDPIDSKYPVQGWYSEYAGSMLIVKARRFCDLNKPKNRVRLARLEMEYHYVKFYICS